MRSFVPPPAVALCWSRLSAGRVKAQDSVAKNSGMWSQPWASPLPHDRFQRSIAPCTPSMSRLPMAQGTQKTSTIPPALTRMKGKSPQYRHGRGMGRPEFCLAGSSAGARGDFVRLRACPGKGLTGGGIIVGDMGVAPHEEKGLRPMVRTEMIDSIAVYLFSSSLHFLMRWCYPFMKDEG